MGFADWFLPPAPQKDGRYSMLKPESILSTLERLSQRIAQRFPESGLYQVSCDFYQTAQHADTLATRLSRPVWPVRLASFAAIGLLIFVAAGAVGALWERFSPHEGGATDLLQALDAAINELILLGLALFFLTGLEARLKREAALQSLHRLRSIAHVVDMHQLTKDPAYLLSGSVDTQASPTRQLTRFELARYLDYCSEMLALNSKVAALFAQNMDDPVVLNAVNDLESLTQGLSGKIWQKIMILDLALRNDPSAARH